MFRVQGLEFKALGLGVKFCCSHLELALLGNRFLGFKAYGSECYSV